MYSIKELYKIGTGPSSSHTAGAARLGKSASKIAGKKIKEEPEKKEKDFLFFSRSAVSEFWNNKRSFKK